MKEGKIAAIVFGTVAVAVSALVVWAVIANDNNPPDERIGSYATYKTSSSFVYSGTFTIEITDINTSTGEVKYTTTWSFRALGMTDQSGSSEQWTPSTEDRINNPFASADTIESKGTERILTKDGQKITNVFLITLPEREATVWIGADNNTLYRIEIPMEGVGKVIWNLENMKIAQL